MCNFCCYFLCMVVLYGHISTMTNTITINIVSNQLDEVQNHVCAISVSPSICWYCDLRFVWVFVRCACSVKFPFDQNQHISSITVFFCWLVHIFLVLQCGEKALLRLISPNLWHDYFSTLLSFSVYSFVFQWSYFYTTQQF